MKKFSVTFLLFALLLCVLPFGVRAAGSASLSGPSTVRAGDTITVTFYAGGGILGGNGTISYDSSVLTLQGTKTLIGGSYNYDVDFNGNNFVFNDNTMENPISGSTAIFSMTFSVKAGVAVGTAVSVKATGVTLSDGDADQGIGTVSYQTTVAPPLSDNANLKSMTVTGATISPAFSPSVTGYTASVPFTTEKITVSAVADHEKAKVTVSNPALTPGGTTTVQVTVTAEKGNTKTYKIAVSRAQDPNYVPSGNADLKTLAVEGVSLSPAFDKAVMQYYIWLPYETETVTLSAQAEDTKSGVEIGTFQLLPGVGTDIPVTVTAEDGTQKVYTVTAVRAPEYEKTEEYLSGEREPVPEQTVPEETLPEESVPEATTEPTVETVPETEATQPDTPKTQTESTGYGMVALLITGIIAAVVGAAITALVFSWKKIF